MKGIKTTTEEFIRRSLLNHTGNTADNYIKVNYVNSTTEVCIICNVHGDYMQLPPNHLKGAGCNECGQERGNKKQMMMLGEFVSKANKIHNFFYKYILSIYTGAFNLLKIICPIHGIFEQVATTHLKGSGCEKCGIEKMRQSLMFSCKEFINECNKMHNYKYNYSLIKEYNGTDKIYKIICPDHGQFLQRGENHLRGHGCRSCQTKSHGENKIKQILNDKKVKFKFNNIFADCINIKTGCELLFDFYLPELNLIIEYDGIQHDKPVKKFGGEASFEGIKFRDNIKNEYCIKNNIHIIRIKYRRNLKKIQPILDEILLLDFANLEHKVHRY